MRCWWVILCTTQREAWGRFWKEWTKAKNEWMNDDRLVIKEMKQNSGFPHWERLALADISKTYSRPSFRVCSERLIKVVERERGVSLRMEWWQIGSNTSKWKAPRWYCSPMQFFPNHWQSVTHVNFEHHTALHIRTPTWPHIQNQGPSCGSDHMGRHSIFWRSVFLAWLVSSCVSKGLWSCHRFISLGHRVCGCFVG